MAAVRTTASASSNLQVFMPAIRRPEIYLQRAQRIKPHPQAMRVGHVKDPGEGLVNQLQTELELSAVIRLRDLSEVTGSIAGAEAAGISVPLKLSVIEGIERFSPELHAEPLRESKVLEERQVEVVMARTAKGVEWSVAVAVRARASHRAGRSREGRRIEPRYSLTILGLGIRDGTGYIGPRSRIADDAGSGSSAHVKVDRRSSFFGDDTREFPATQRSLHQTAPAVAENRDIIDEVGKEHAPAVVNRRAPIITPSLVRIGGIFEIAAAAGRRSRIVCFREGIGYLQMQVMRYSPVQRGLE